MDSLRGEEKDRSDVVTGLRVGERKSGRVLDELTITETVGVVQTGDDGGVGEDFCSCGGEGRM